MITHLSIQTPPGKSQPTVYGVEIDPAEPPTESGFVSAESFVILVSDGQRADEPLKYRGGAFPVKSLIELDAVSMIR